MRLAAALCSANALLEHVLCFLDEQAVKIHCVGRDAALGIVGAEDVVARLLVVLVHFGGVLLAFVGELLCARAIARFVGGVRAVEARGALGGFLSREVAEPVVFGLGVA